MPRIPLAGMSIDYVTPLHAGWIAEVVIEKVGVSRYGTVNGERPTDYPGRRSELRVIQRPLLPLYLRVLHYFKAPNPSIGGFVVSVEADRQLLSEPDAMPSSSIKTGTHGIAYLTNFEGAGTRFDEPPPRPRVPWLNFLLDEARAKTASTGRRYTASKIAAWYRIDCDRFDYDDGRVTGAKRELISQIECGVTTKLGPTSLAKTGVSSAAMKDVDH